MRCDGRDNTKKLRSFISIVVPSKNKNENKNSLNGCSDFGKTIIMARANNNNDSNSNNNNTNTNNNSNNNIKVNNNNDGNRK